MPDTWLRWGTDGDGDGLADPWDPEDAVFAAARYLAATGGTRDISRAIFAYNHAQWYVDEVLGLASLFGGDVDVVFTLDKLAIRLEEAQTAVAETSKALREAKSRAAELQLRVTALDDRAAAADLLLSDRLDVEKEAFEVDQENAAAAAEVERLQAELTTAEEVLEPGPHRRPRRVLQPGRRGHSRRPEPSGRLRVPGRWRPRLRQRRALPSRLPRRGHCRPGGIAGLRARRLDRARHGRRTTAAEPGCILQTPDGIHWLYCHLSQRDSAVLPGAVLSAGQWVGLVGSTGDATGPHLHLAVKPETSYPQDMTWFQEFAGTAFAWQDAPTALTADPFRSSPVFAVVPSVRSRRRGGRVHDCPFKGLSFMPFLPRKSP